jgi:hypothetical protein
MSCTDQCIYLPSMRGKIKRRKVKPSGEASGSNNASSSLNQPPTQPPAQSDAYLEQWDKERRRTMDGSGSHNSSLWDPPQSSTATTNDLDNHSLAVTSPEASSSRSQQPSTIDKLTTLPLRGDAHNPLSVLVELSEAASNSEPRDRRQSSFQNSDLKRQREEEEYYAPLERTLKDEAPQIMALINTHECVAIVCY